MTITPLDGGEGMGALRPSGFVPGQTEAPVRVKLSRQKGWRMPENTVKVDRSTRWGNPWKVGDNRLDREADCFRPCRDVEDTVAAFRQCVDWDPSAVSYLPTEEGHLEIWGGYDDNIHVNRSSIRRFLGGKNLACWCALDAPCHADVLLELANPEATTASAGGTEGEARSAHK